MRSMSSSSTSNKPTEPSDAEQDEKKPSKLRSIVVKVGGALLRWSVGLVAVVLIAWALTKIPSPTPDLYDVPHAARDACKKTGGTPEAENLFYNIGKVRHSTGEIKFCLTKEGSMGEVWSPKIPLDGSMMSAEEWTTVEVAFAKQCAKSGGTAYRTVEYLADGGGKFTSTITLNTATCIKDGYPIASYNDKQ